MAVVDETPAPESGYLARAWQRVAERAQAGYDVVQRKLQKSPAGTIPAVRQLASPDPLTKLKAELALADFVSEKIWHGLTRSRITKEVADNHLWPQLDAIRSVARESYQEACWRFPSQKHSWWRQPKATEATLHAAQTRLTAFRAWVQSGDPAYIPVEVFPKAKMVVRTAASAFDPAQPRAAAPAPAPAAVTPPDPLAGREVKAGAASGGPPPLPQTPRTTPPPIPAQAAGAQLPSTPGGTAHSGIPIDAAIAQAKAAAVAPAAAVSVTQTPGVRERAQAWAQKAQARAKTVFAHIQKQLVQRYGDARAQVGGVAQRISANLGGLAEGARNLLGKAQAHAPSLQTTSTWVGRGGVSAGVAGVVDDLTQGNANAAAVGGSTLAGFTALGYIAPVFTTLAAPLVGVVTSTFDAVSNFIEEGIGSPRAWLSTLETGLYSAGYLAAASAAFNIWNPVGWAAGTVAAGSLIAAGTITIGKQVYDRGWAGKAWNAVTGLFSGEKKENPIPAPGQSPASRLTPEGNPPAPTRQSFADPATHSAGSLAAQQREFILMKDARAAIEQAGAGDSKDAQADSTNAFDFSNPFSSYKAAMGRPAGALDMRKDRTELAAMSGERGGNKAAPGAAPASAPPPAAGETAKTKAGNDEEKKLAAAPAAQASARPAA